MKPPTHEELCDVNTWDEDADIKSVQRSADDSWRHGSYILEVFHRKSDDTYWAASYRLSTDGETNELREGFADISQVKPKEITTVVYEGIDA